MRVFIATLFALLALASPAAASQVTNVTLDNTGPSNAAGARTVYRVGFKATTAFSGATGGQITIAVPAGTAFPNYSGVIFRGATQLGGCGPSGVTIVCSLNSTQTVAAGDTIVVALRGVANPTLVGPISAKVHTTSDVDDVTSTNATVATGQTLAAPTVNIAQPSAATGARTVYRVDFTLTSTGGLAGEAGSQLVVGMPAGTTYNNFSAVITDVTATTDIGGCTQSGLTITCTPTFNSVAAAGHQMRLTLRGVINGPAGTTKTVTVRTTSDLPDATSANFAIVAAQSVSAVGVNNTAPSAAAGARTLYVVDFTLSNTGGLAGEAGSQIVATMPAGTTFYNNFSAVITDITKGVDLGGCTESGLTVTCTPTFNSVADPGDRMRLTLRGVINGSVVGTDKIVKVTTTSDVAQTVNSDPFSVIDGHPVSTVSVDPGTPSAAAGARTVYRVDFTASETGGLDGEAGSQIFISMPAGTTYGSNFGSEIRDLTSNQALGGCFVPTTLLITCSPTFNSSSNAGHRLQVSLRGVINGAAGTGKLAKVMTTSDLPNVDSAPFTLVAGNPVTDVVVDHATPSPAAGARTRYNVDFTLSGTGGLTGEAGSSITTSFPAGTTFASGWGATIIDLSRNNTQIGSCSAASGVNVTCALNFNSIANAGDRMRITFRGVVNAAVGSGQIVKVATTTDLSPVDSAPFTIVAGGQVSGVSESVGSTGASATSAHVISFTTSATGGLRGEAGSSVDVTFPTGATVASASAQFTRGGTTIGGCAPVASTQIQRCSLNFFSFTLPGDQIRIRFPQVTNPVGGAAPVTVTTTSDLTPVQSSAPAVNPLDTTITDGPDPISNDTSPTFEFTGTGSGFQCSLDGATFTTCISPSTPTNVADGTHTYRVRASDGTGGFDTTPDSYTFVIDTGAPETTITGGPSGETTDATPSFTFTGTGDGFECKLDSFSYEACDSPLTTATLGLGSHTLLVRATDLAGNADQTPASRAFTVIDGGNGPALDTTITSGPASPSNITSPSFSFTGTGTGFECSLDNGAFATCHSPLILLPLAPGEHTFRVRATDPDGVDTTPASRTFVIDTATPEPVVDSPQMSNATATFTFSAGEAGSSFTCSIDDGAFSACSSPYTTPALPAGEHVFAVRARDAAGNTGTTTRPFTVTAVLQQTPTPTPSATPVATPTPTPVPNKSVVGEPVGGTVLICQAPGVKCVPLTAGQSIPVGSVVDTKNGRIELTAIPRAGQPPETAVFYDGIFKVTQKDGITDLALVEPLAPCGKAKAAAGKKAKTRKLWGDGKGRFRTSGKYSAATVRGTKWLVQDSCAGTLTKVAQGVVSVRDKVKGKTIVVRAPKSYTAKPRR